MMGTLGDTFSILKSLIAPIIIIFFGILTINLTIFWFLTQRGIEIYVSQPSLGNMLTASIALASLYIAWRNFIYKRKPFVKATWDVEYTEDGDNPKSTIYLKLINLGESTVGLQGFEWSYGQAFDNQISFNLNSLAYFEEDHLEPDAMVKHKLGEDLVVAQIDSLPVQKPNGQNVQIETPIREKQLVRLENIPEQAKDLSTDIQKLFRRLKETDYRVGPIVGYDELSRNDIEDILEEYPKNESNIWSRMKFRYESWRYGTAVMGDFYDDPISRVLDWLDVRLRKKKKRRRPTSRPQSSYSSTRFLISETIRDFI